MSTDTLIVYVFLNNWEIGIYTWKIVLVTIKRSLYGQGHYCLDFILLRIGIVLPSYICKIVFRYN